MKDNLKKIFQNSKSFLAKWGPAFAVGCFLGWILFFDQFCLVDRIAKKNELRKLNERIEENRSKLKSNRARLYELENGKEELEKFAREQYNMKESNEDVFVIVIDE